MINRLFGAEIETLIELFMLSTGLAVLFFVITLLLTGSFLAITLALCLRTTSTLFRWLVRSIQMHWERL